MRPPAPERAFEGCHWEAVEEDPKVWRAIAPELARPCRQLRRPRSSGPNERTSCKTPSVAAMNRTAGGQNWWHYCGAHLYGRWVEDTEQGLKVFHWRLIEDVELPV